MYVGKICVQICPVLQSWSHNYCFCFAVNQFCGLTLLLLNFIPEKLLQLPVMPHILGTFI